MAFFSLSAGVLGYVIFIVEVQQERPGDCSLLAEDVGGIIDVAQRCSQQVVKTYPQAVWLAMTTMFQVLYGDYIPTSHVARIMCAIATFNGLLISSTIIAMFSRTMMASEFETFALQLLGERRARKTHLKWAAIFVQV